MVALVPLIVVMRRSLVRLQVRALAEGGAAEFALVRPFAGVGAFVIANFRFPGESFAALPAHVRFVSGVHYGMYFQVV